MKSIICITCGKEKLVKAYLANRQKHCSLKCKGKDKEITKRIALKSSKTIRKLIADGKYHSPWNKGLNVRLSPNSEFKKGSNPWNKNTKGVMKKNTGSFKKGIIPLNKMPVGTILIRQEHTNRNTRNKKRNWIKVGEPNKWELYYRWIWRKIYGEIPKGYIIHHIDRNALNDNIENLDCLTRAEHINEHRSEIRK